MKVSSRDKSRKLCAALLCVFLPLTSAAESPDPGANGFSVAVLPFAADEKQYGELGRDLQSLITAHLSSDPKIILVERAELDAALSETELGISGTVDPETAAKIGYITGAQILVTGRSFGVQKELVTVAKIIGTETSRVYGETATMPLRGSAVEMSVELAEKITNTINVRGNTLIATRVPKEDVVATLRPLVEGKTLPSVFVSISEVSLNETVPDPAAETEIAYILQQLGFTIIDPDASNELADIEVTGEAFSEFGLRKGNLVSTKARIEIKAIDRSAGEVLLVDRETAVAVDLSPEIAGKNALAKGAAKLAERLVRRIVGEN
jgi:hypothetical protein